MSQSTEVDAGAGVIYSSESLNQDLVRQLIALTDQEHTSADCWKPARPMIGEAIAWVVGGAILWVLALFLVA